MKNTRWSKKIAIALLSTSLIVPTMMPNVAVKAEESTVQQQIVTIKQAKLLPLNTQVTVEATVTNTPSPGLGTKSINVYIQDATGGMILYGPYSDKLKEGDKIRVTGSLSTYNDLVQISKVTEYTIIEPSNGDVQGAPIALDTLLNDVSAYTNMLLEFKNVSFSLPPNTKYETAKNFTMKQGGREVAYFVGNDPQWRPSITDDYESVKLYVSLYKGKTQLIPHSATSAVKSEVIVPSIVGGVERGTKVALTSKVPNTKIRYTVDGTGVTESSPEYNGDITIEQNMTINAALYNAENQLASKSFKYEYIIGERNYTIEKIQGTTHETQYKGKYVLDVEGIVTKKDDNKGFYLQSSVEDNDAATSSAIYVLKNTINTPVNVGDAVKVSGFVKEMKPNGYDGNEATDLTTTVIDAGNIVVTAIGQPLPPAKVIGSEGYKIPEVIAKEALGNITPGDEAIDFFESLESMRVEVPKPLILSPVKNSNIFVSASTYATTTEAGNPLLLNYEEPKDILQVKIDANDKDGRNFIYKAGDQFTKNINGVLGYEFSKFIIHPENAYDLQKSVQPSKMKQEVTNLQGTATKLSYGVYNLENFSANKNFTSVEKVAGIAHNIAVAMKAPDIVNLIEVQDNDGKDDTKEVSAEGTLQKLVDELKKNHNVDYRYVQVNPEQNADGGESGANIRPAFIYRPDRVKFTQVGTVTSKTEAAIENGKLVVNPSRIGTVSPHFNASRKSVVAQFTFNNRVVTVIGSHLNSKLGDAPPYGLKQPAVKPRDEKNKPATEVQREGMASEINKFIKQLKQQDPEAIVISSGDFNDFQFSQATKNMAGDELINAVDKIDEKDRFSYIFEGKAQTIDHILVSKHLADRVVADAVHINTLFGKYAGRFSDHDPLVATIELDKSIALSNVTFKGKYVVKKASVLAIGDGVTFNKGIELEASATLYGKLDNIRIAITKPGVTLQVKGKGVTNIIVEAGTVPTIKGAEQLPLALQEQLQQSGAILIDSHGQPIGK